MLTPLHTLADVPPIMYGVEAPEALVEAPHMLIGSAQSLNRTLPKNGPLPWRHASLRGQGQSGQVLPRGATLPLGLRSHVGRHGAPEAAEGVLINPLEAAAGGPPFSWGG